MLDELKLEYNALVRELEDMKKVIDGGKRNPTDEERKKAQEVLTKIDQVEQEIKGLEVREQIDEALKRSKDSRHEPTRPDLTRAEDRKKFRSLGEQLHSIIAAGSPGGMLDARLTRAASGASETVPSDGGFLVQQDFAAELLKNTYETGQVVSRVRRIPISGTANGLKINALAEASRAHGSRWGGIRAYWADEAAEKTSSRPTFRQMELSLKKLIGLCYATDELIQDAAALQSIISQGFGDEFSFMLDDVLINGSGAGQPLGIMNSACLVTVGRNTAATVKHEDIIGMWSRCWARSRVNSVWFINQDVEPQLNQMSLAVGTAGGQLTYLPPGGVSERPYGTLMGRPVIPIEQCQTMGTSGDIILADFGEYLMIDKGGVQSAQSIHVRFIYDEVAFRFVLRVDGQPTWNAPLVPFKGANTLSPFVVLS